MNKVYEDIESLLDAGGKAEDVLLMLVNKWGLTADTATRILANYISKYK